VTVRNVLPIPAATITFCVLLVKVLTPIVLLVVHANNDNVKMHGGLHAAASLIYSFSVILSIRTAIIRTFIRVIALYLFIRYFQTNIYAGMDAHSPG
jgi:hypothetical protein